MYTTIFGGEVDGSIVSWIFDFYLKKKQKMVSQRDLKRNFRCVKTV